MSRACVFDLSSTLASHSSVVSPIFYFILLNFDFYLLLPCGSVRNKITCALRPMRSLALWPITPLSQFERWLHRTFVDRAEPELGDRRCHHHPDTVGPLASVFLQSMSRIIGTDKFFWPAALKVLDSLHSIALFTSQAPFVQ